MSIPEIDLVYEPNFINNEYQNELLEFIETLDFNNILNRETFHFGYEYPYNLREPYTVKLKKAQKIPKILYDLCEDLYLQDYLDFIPDQIIINKYEPGQGISPHRDHHPLFQNGIATISLGSDVNMIFKPHPKHGKDFDEEIDIRLNKGSLLVMKNVSRYNYTHEIKKRKNDVYLGKKIPRSTRYSITFRKICASYI